MVNWKKIVCNLITCYTAIQVAFRFSTMNTTNIYCLFYFILCTDPGFQVRGWCTYKNCAERRQARKFLGYFVWKITILRQKKSCFPILGRAPRPWGLYVSLCQSVTLSLFMYMQFFHFVSPLEIHNLYFGKHNKEDKSYKFMLQVANFHS